MPIRHYYRASLAVALALLICAGCVTTAPSEQTAPPSPGQQASQQTSQRPIDNRTDNPSDNPTDPPVAKTPPPDDTPPPPDNPAETVIAWLVGLGPGSPEGPTQVDVYKLIREGTLESCQLGRDEEMLARIANETTRALYRGATSACLAALHGRVNRWDDARDAFASLAGRPEPCVDQAAYDLLESVLLAHAADPEAIFTRDGEPGDGQPNRIRLECPRVTLLTVTRVPAGGYEVYVEGARLNKVVHVAWDPVATCPQPADKEPPAANRSDPIVENGTLRTSIAEDFGPNQEFMWIGLLAEPYPWVSAYECVEILEMAPV